MNEINGITSDILLDAGTNELEVLVFKLGPGWFGVNVAKVREVIRPVKSTATPHQHPSVIGMFNIRGVVVPVVDLGRHLSIPSARAEGEEGRVIITEFNGLRTGFLVDSVEQIHRLSWQKVKPTPNLSIGGAGSGPASAGTPADISSTTGVLELPGADGKDRLVLMLDFESVADAILVEKRLHIGSVDNPHNVDRGSKRVIIVEDSPFMRSLMREVFVESGYAKLEVYSDGQMAWDAISQTEGKPRIDAIISDIEMPRMDGLHLTKRIKDNAALKDVPVVLFSSLVSEDNKKKGQQVGADVQIPKPELQEMVRLVDRVVSGQPVDLSKQVVIRGEANAVKAA